MLAKIIMRWNRAVLIVTIIAVITLAGLLLYFFLVRQGPRDQGDLSGISPANSLPTASSQTNPASGLNETGINAIEERVPVPEKEAAELIMLVQRLVNTEVAGSTLTADGTRIMYYDKSDPAILSVDFLGSNPVSLQSPSHPVASLQWSLDKTRLVYSAEDNRVWYFDLASGQEQLLGDKITDPVFLDDNARIAYQYLDSASNKSNVSIGRVAEQLRDYKVLAEMLGQIKLQRVNGTKQVAYCLIPKDGRTSALYTVDVNTGEKQILLDQAVGTNAKWSDDGAAMVYQRLNNQNRLQLFIADFSGRNARVLARSTFVEKVAWDKSRGTLLLAVPRNLPTIDAFYQQRVRTQDILYEVDPADGRVIGKYDLAAGSGQRNYDLRNIFLSPDGNLLFFENGFDNGLYAVNLKQFRELSAGTQ